MRRYLSRNLAAVFLASSVIGFAPLQAAAQTPRPADGGPPITVAGYDVGSFIYAQTGYIAEAISEKFGTSVRIMPLGNDVSRTAAARSPRALALVTGGGSYAAFEGLEEFCTLELGPQPVHAIRLGQHPGLALAVSGDSDIKDGKDLRGKRIPEVVGASGVQQAVDSTLAFSGLTRKDVKIVRFSSFASHIEGHKAGQIDVVSVAVTTPYALELGSGSAGVRFIESPPDDKAGWERVRKLIPIYSPIRATLGAAKGKPIWAKSYVTPGIFAFEQKDAEQIYQFTKAIDQSEQLWASKHEMMKLLSQDAHWSLFSSGLTPMHAGAKRYYKETGRWTPEMERTDQAALARQARLKNAWEALKADVAQKKVDAKDLASAWLRKRSEMGL